MRLLNARTYELQTFLDTNKPKYAILSHTWEDGEVLFEDIQDTSNLESNEKKGYFKIKKTCEQALKDRCEFVWIDTCNINKDSSSELSEAINSMFRWYRDATICYAYISDIKDGDGWSFSKCRWLTRGWTLQEMIAPDRVHFYDKEWCFLGSRITLANELSRSSGVDISVLLRRDYLEERHNNRYIIANGRSYPTKPKGSCQCCTPTKQLDVRSMLNDFSVAQKMKWASTRRTTRKEDVGYCLMGLFDVNMPLLYGEGTRAFFRLQKAILEMQSDHSIFAFRSFWSDTLDADSPEFLAPNPNVFRDDVRSIFTSDLGAHTSLNGTALSIDMLICPVESTKGSTNLHLGILDCSMSFDPYRVPAIVLSAVDEDRAIFIRTFETANLVTLHPSHPREARVITKTPLRSNSTAFSYDPEDIKRVRISIISKNTAVGSQRHAIPHVRVNLSSVFQDWEYHFTSLPPLAAEHMLDITSSSGRIDFSDERTKQFSVNWNTKTRNKFQCSISSCLESETAVVIPRQSDFDVDANLESIDRYLNTPHMEIGKSKTIVLKGPGKTSFGVWISMSREIFIGRSSLVLSVHGTVVSESNRETESQGEAENKRQAENKREAESKRETRRDRKIESDRKAESGRKAKGSKKVESGRKGESRLIPRLLGR